VTDGEPALRPIGEVLAVLQAEFPDVSVSKIRFLESQGLIAPQRTASGYRQFTDSDVELLRWILRLQREQYLPLKVIRSRLRAGDGPWGDDVKDVKDEIVEEAAMPAPPVGGAEVAAAGPLSPAPPAPPEEDLWSAPASDVRLSLSDLAREAGLSEAAVGELESFGLLAKREDGFDGDALAVARVAAGFARYGVEARHLRMYKTFAEREATLFDQVLPMVTARSAEAGKERQEALADLAGLGQALRRAMLRTALGDSDGGP
jgi:DNA-binding transcriptional MerR regulator